MSRYEAEDSNPLITFTNSNPQLPSVIPEELAGPPVTPIGRGQRLPTLDVLRGVALLGILLLNIQDFAGHEALWNFPVGLSRPAFVAWHARLDYLIVSANWMLAEGKMRGLFSMLFGAGTVLLIERVAQRAGPRRAAVIFYRRSLWLLLFGLVHGFMIWWGDILLYYAVMALIFLYPLRRLPARRLISLGLCLWIVGGTFGSFGFMQVTDTLRTDASLQATRNAGHAATLQQRAALVEVSKRSRAEASEYLHQEHLGYLSGVRHRVREEVNFLILVFRSFFFLEMLGAMITGMGFYKIGFLTNRIPSREYILIACCGYAISWTLTITGLWHMFHSSFSATVNARWISIPYDVQVATGALANTSVLLLIIRSGRFKAVLEPVANVGRTALSNYILTSLVCKLLFSWGPWKLYGALEFYQWYLVVAAIWTINLLLSSLWLQRFAFGPLEWLWRSLTYWKPQQMRLLHPMKS